MSRKGNVAHDGPDVRDVAMPVKMHESGPSIRTYRIANFLGFSRKTPVGIRAKQTTNIAAAARFRPPKMSIRSHRLTVARTRQPVPEDSFLARFFGVADVAPAHATLTHAYKCNTQELHPLTQICPAQGAAPSSGLLIPGRLGGGQAAGRGNAGSRAD